MDTILIADDNHDILDLLEILIDSHFSEYRIVKYLNSKSAIMALKNDYNKEIKLIISDYEMPGGNGDELYKYNIENKNNIPFIFHSSSLDTHLKELSYSDSFTTVAIDKPADPDNLIESINTLLNTEFTRSALEYYPIRPIDILKHINHLEEVFLKINDSHYTLVSRKDFPNNELIKKYIFEKQVKFFFVKAVDFKFILNKSDAKISSIKDFSNHIKLTQIYAKNFFDDPEECLLIDKKIDDLFNEVKKSNKLTGLFIHLLKKGDFIISHSILTYYLSYNLLKKENIHTEANLQDFFYAIFFHDLYTSIHKKEDSKHHFELIGNVERIQTATNLTKILDPNSKALDMIEKHTIINDNFNNLENLNKIFNSAHLIATFSCEEKNYNYKEIKEVFLKDKSPSIYKFLLN